jgi:hypothetical protein
MWTPPSDVRRPSGGRVIGALAILIGDISLPPDRNVALQTQGLIHE